MIGARNHPFMKVLLVHPDDSLEVGAWTEHRWDLIVDLGWSGRHSCSLQEKRFGCEVRSLCDLLDHDEHRFQLRELLGAGLNYLVDSESVDWWDMFSALHYQQIEQLMLLRILGDKITEYADIFATREDSTTKLLASLLKRPIKAFAPIQKTGIGMQGRRYWKRMLALRPSQIAEIAFDKWDTGYRLRRRVNRNPSPSAIPAVLLPSAYGNVSRAQLAYAQMLPERRFLLVYTRQSGRRRLHLPANVEVRSLAAYAPKRSLSSNRERVRLLARWQELQSDRFARNPVLGLAPEMGMFAAFPKFLESGLRVRDAWREVLAKEALTAVLSADEHNPFTRLPVVLAATRKVRTVFCDHGALNMSFAIRRARSDIYLASGKMAQDYLTTWCGLPAERIIVGGAQEAHGSAQVSAENGRDWIVFFSEQYELSSGRTQTLYSELLPELCSLARQSNRKVIVKLHPFESRRVRKAMIERLTENDRALVEIRDGPMTPDLFDRAWFTVTVESSVAVESTLNGVPCFLCRWFDGSWYEYARQYEKFSAGYRLDSPVSVRQIPQLLERIKITDATREVLHTSINPEKLDSILFGRER